MLQRLGHGLEWNQCGYQDRPFNDDFDDEEKTPLTLGQRIINDFHKRAKDTAAKDTVVLHPSDTSPWVGEDDDEDVPDSWDSLADD